MTQEYKYIIGIDEAGRGPLAGPVSVGVAIVPVDFDWETLPGVGDSKALSEKKRETIFLRALELQQAGQIDYAAILVSANVIDSRGIVIAVKEAMMAALQEIKNRTIFSYTADTVLVKLDGGLVAPPEYTAQETIIKGDSKEKVIGLASIMAKVTRDRYMVEKGGQVEFFEYGFQVHKGYATKAHRAAIAEFGFTPEHRVSYCKNIKML